MDPRQLRIFKALYDSGSITAAGNLERCAPSVVAHHLANLEHRLGVSLFERSRRGVVPTPAGQKFHGHALAILRAIDGAESDMRDTPDRLSGRVVLGLAFSAVTAFAVTLMRRVVDEHPDLHLEIAESVSGATIKGLLAADTDLAVAFNPPKDSRLLLVPLLEEEMICIGRRDIIGEPDRPMAMDDFLSRRFVLPRRGPLGRPMADDVDVQKRLEHHASLFSQNVVAAVLFVNSGLGLGLGTRANLLYGAYAQDVVGRPVAGRAITRTMYLCLRRDTPVSRAMAYMRDVIIDCVETEVAEGRWPCRLLI
ncbi:LysR family transcriptional regulator [Limimaricola pyoseonensis]|uniref:LysR family transcriptional regulator, nitrogen assimilation regulatory protein n=1 Tax=Limimaricola pyoseonensis TaxID=521013 RepID=A0A1G7G3C3_9RHOB|nr:LysR family transcriptional regulator [Limimaricola pyoseonensis]SDE82529.1 LysR family transcriptional regulator, nitrogen assimilation regulatory protein [Limimaricola pyoseonensis]